MSVLAMRSHLVNPALGAVRAAGGNVSALLQRFDLGPEAETEKDVSLPVDTLRSFLDAAAVELDEPAFGLRVARRFPRGMYGLTEFAARTAPTLGDAWNRVARYIGLLNELVVIRVDAHGKTAVIDEHIPGAPECLGRHANEFFVSLVVLQSREMCGVPVVPRRVHLAHRAPVDSSALHEALGCDLVFGADANRVEFDPEILRLPLLSADAPLHSLLDGQAQKAMAARSSPSRLVGLVRASIADNLMAPRTLDAVASTIRLSPRTLQRRLGEEGATFQQLVDDVREQMARREIAAGRGLAEIAANLGYASIPPFLRAFKRWTGMTPGAYRRQLAS
jgi:AraC-like DNA-binding protein